MVFILHKIYKFSGIFYAFSILNKNKKEYYTSLFEYLSLLVLKMSDSLVDSTYF